MAMAYTIACYTIATIATRYVYFGKFKALAGGVKGRLIPAKLLLLLYRSRYFIIGPHPAYD